MKTPIPCALGIFLLSFSSCKENNSNLPEAKDLKLSVAEQQKVQTDNSFTFKLFKGVLKNESNAENIFISPLSANTVLAMTSNGSNGETLKNMRNSLQFTGMSEDEINSYYHKLLTELPNIDPKTTLKIANSIWYRKGFDVLPEFMKANTDYFKATVEELDFSQPTSKDKINSWVKKETNDKIPSIIDQIPNDAVMYLINAIYFKGQWKHQFDKSKTRKQAFYLGDNSTVQTDFMSAEATVKTYNDETAQVIELPYGSDKFTMVIMQPNQNNSVVNLVTTLNENKWQQWITGLRETKTTIILPKFKFSYETLLNPALTDLGMGIAFTPIADFTRINTNGGLLISNVKQKAFVEVNEEGTEAAAATSVEIVLTSVGASIVVNRPFLFAIREKNSGLILFIGQVNNPLLEG